MDALCSALRDESGAATPVVLAPVRSPRRRTKVLLLLAVFGQGQAITTKETTASGEQQLLFPWRQASAQAHLSADSSGVQGPQKVSLAQVSESATQKMSLTRALERAFAAADSQLKPIPAGPARDAAERKQILEDMGHLESRFENVKATQAALRGQLLAEAARLQEAQRTIAEAKKTAEMAQARARRSEIGYIAVVFASFLGALAWTFSAKYMTRPSKSSGGGADGDSAKEGSGDAAKPVDASPAAVAAIEAVEVEEAPPAATTAASTDAPAAVLAVAATTAVVSVAASADAAAAADVMDVAAASGETADATAGVTDEADAAPPASRTPQTPVLSPPTPVFSSEEPATSPLRVTAPRVIPPREGAPDAHCEYYSLVDNDASAGSDDDGGSGAAPHRLRAGDADTGAIVETPTSVNSPASSTRAPRLPGEEEQEEGDPI